MAERWVPGKPHEAAPVAPAPTGVRTADGRTTFLVAREVVKPGKPVEHTVEALAAINDAAGKIRKVNYVPYDPFGVPNRQMDHTALMAVFTHNGRLFFSVPDGAANGRGRRVFLIERETEEQQGSVSVKGGNNNQSLSLSSRTPLQHYLSTITPGEVEVAERLLEPWLHLEEGILEPHEKPVAAEMAATRQELSRSLAFVLEEDLMPVEDNSPVEHIVTLADLARPVSRPPQETPAAATARPVPATLQLQTVPDSMTADMITESMVIGPNQETPVPLSPEAPEEFALFETPKEGAAPRDFLRIVVFGGSVATSVCEEGKWGDYKFLDKNGLWKGPGRGAGFILSLHQTGAPDDNVSISALRDPVILARLKPGSTGLDRDRLKNSRTAAEREAALQAHLEKVRAGRLRPRSGREDVLGGALPSGVTRGNTVIPKSVGSIPERESTPSITRTHIALAVGAALSLAAVAGIALRGCPEDEPQQETPDMVAPNED